MKSITIYNMKEEFPAAEQLVEDTLRRNRINRVMHTETKMIFEALYHNVQEQLENSGTTVTVSAKERLGDLRITIGFEGGMMDPTENYDTFSPETQILKTYSDKYNYSYRFGYNRIDITVRKSFLRKQMLYLLAALLAIAVYVPIQLQTTPMIRQGLLDDIVFPLEQLFTNAMFMIAAPITFISLLKNRTNSYIISEWNVNVRRLHRSASISSFVAVLLAIGAGTVADMIIGTRSGLLLSHTNLQIHFTPAEFISSLMPSNIFDPFVTISPFPLIILSLMMTYALFSVGEHFDLIYHLINAFYEMTSRILTLIMAALPFFLFTAVLDVLLRRGYMVLLNLLELYLIVIVSQLLLWLYYALRLKRVGLKPLSFFQSLQGLLRENYLINSAIDAAPYNIRWCVLNLKLNRKRLQESMPIMAQINLDGNCFLITLTSLLFMSYSSGNLTPLYVIEIGILVLFLSMGAPNQPGSCLVGILIILFHMKAFSLVPLAIITEAMFGGLLNLLNVTGDIITVTADDAATNASGRPPENKTQ